MKTIVILKMPQGRFVVAEPGSTHEGFTLADAMNSEHQISCYLKACGFLQPAVDRALIDLRTRGHIVLRAD
jgi:hypothetical protein